MPTTPPRTAADTDQNGAPDIDPTQGRERIFEATLDYFLGPIREHLQDESVTEIMVNGFREVYIERAGRLIKTGSRFASEDSLRSAIHNVAQYVGREIDENRPILDARLPDGSRVHAVIPPSARQGTYLTIRRFKRDIYSLEDFHRLGSISESATLLQICRCGRTSCRRRDRHRQDDVPQRPSTAIRPTK